MLLLLLSHLILLPNHLRPKAFNPMWQFSRHIKITNFPMWLRDLMTALTLSTSKVFEEVKIENGNSKPGINKGLMLFAQNSLSSSGVWG